MKLKTLLLLLPLGACAGGPIATDAEIGYLLAENSAVDQTFAATADAEVTASLTPLLDAVQGAVAWLATVAATPMPPEIVEDLEAAGVRLTTYSPPVPVVPPDPATKPEDSFDWGKLIELACAAIFGTGGAVALRSMDHRKKRLAKESTKTT